MRAIPVCLLAIVAVACGSSPAPSPDVAPAPAESAAAPVASAPASTPPAPEKAHDAPAFPTACSESGKELCVPTEEAVNRICHMQESHVAFALFAKGSPWTRGYLTRDADAWYASGGASARGKVQFDEEVLLLRKRAAGGIVQGQGGGYDVLRWDGSCASLQAEEITMKKPPKAKHPAIGWKNVESKTRDALLADAKVLSLFEKRRKECKGANSGDVTLACVKADAALDAGIVEFIRAGGTIPTPTLPK